MKKRDMTILGERLIEKRTWDEIGTLHGNTRQWAHQEYGKILQSILYNDFYMKWLEKNKIIEYAENEIMDLILLMGPSNKEKIIVLINRFEIKHPKDILKLTKKEILSIKGMGEVFFINLKIALLKFGLPYDHEDAESLMHQLETYQRVSGELGLSLRFKILKRDHFRCHYCGRSPRKDKNVVLHVDHIIPVAAGGLWEESNLITACLECNLGKGAKITVSPDAF